VRRSISVIAAAVFALVSASGAMAAEHRAGELVVEHATMKTETGEVVPYEVGTLYVPENRDAPHSRLIGVGFARIKASTGKGAAPGFVLPGGPGDSYMDAFAPTGLRALRQQRQLLRYRRIGDVVIVDQRGFTARGEKLTYTGPRPPRPLDQPADLAADSAADVALAKAAVAANADKDLAGYSVMQMVADVDDLRQALGYRKINLIGQSFGSQWSLAVMRLRPQIVQRALLSGVEPLDNAYDMPAHIYAALQRIAWDADQDPKLKPYLPEGGLMGAARALHDRFAAGPITVTLADPKGGAPVKVVLGLGDLQRNLIMPAESWPAAILTAYYGHYDDLARAVVADRTATSFEGAMIGPLIDTSLGVSAAREHLLRTDAARDIVGLWNFDSYIAQAPVWPTPDFGDANRIPIQSPIPVLFLHGDWDASTPLDNTLGLLPFFPNGRAVIIHRGEHSARSLLFEQKPEVFDLAMEFLATGATRGLPSRVELSVPDFTVPTFPPSAR
jgi:pimeloyl-ACP methyl ester carboxylesterase